MTLLFMDGFDGYATNADFVLGRWHDNTNMVISPTTRFGVGQSAQGNTGSSRLRRDFGVSLTTVIVGMAYRFSSPTASAGYSIGFLDSAGAAQLTFIQNTGTGLLEARRGTNAGPLIGTSSSWIVSNVWHFLEFKVTFNDTTGSILIRLDGVPILDLSNIDTVATGLANARAFYVNGATSQQMFVDDFYICDTTGARNNDFLGDVRIETLRPSGDTTQKDFLCNAAGSLLMIGSSNAVNQPTVNYLHFRRFTIADNEGVLQSMALTPLITNPTLRLRAALYTDTDASDLCLRLDQSSEVVGITAGIPIVFTFSGGVTLRRGIIYLAALQVDASTSNGFSYLNNGGLVLSGQPYANGFPPGPLTVFSTGHGFAWTISYIKSNYGSVTDVTQDGDASYVSSATPGAKDRYVLEDIAQPPDSIKAVQLVGMWRKGDAGARSAQLVVQSSATEVLGAATPLPSNYVYQTHLMEVDPATGAEWTTPGVNALEAGVRVAS